MSKIQTIGASAAPNNISTGIPWADVDIGSAEGKSLLCQDISSYFSEIKIPGQIGYMKATHSSDLTPPVPEVPDINFYQPRSHASVINLFRYVDRRQSKNPVYEFGDTALGVTFKQTREGEPADIRGIKGTAADHLTHIEFTAGLGISDTAKRFDTLSEYEQHVQAAPNSYESMQAGLHTALFTALPSSINQTWDSDLATTVSNAYSKILDDCGDVYNLLDNATMGLLYNPYAASRVRQMLASAYTVANDNNSASELLSTPTLIPNRRIPANTMYLVLPGHNMVSVEWDDLKSEQGRDHAKRAESIVWSARSNAAIGNINQVRRITLQ